MTMIQAHERGYSGIDYAKHPRNRVFRAGMLSVIVGFGVAWVMLAEDRSFDERTTGLIEMIAVSALFGGFVSEMLVDRYWSGRSPLKTGMMAAFIALLVSLVTMIALNGLIFTATDFRVHEPIWTYMGLKQFFFTLAFGSGFFVVFGLRLLVPYAVFGYLVFGLLVTYR